MTPDPILAGPLTDFRPDFSEPSWPLRLETHRGKPTEWACLASIRDEAMHSDRDVARAAQCAMDGGDFSDLDLLFERANSLEEPEPPAWSWCVATVERWEGCTVNTEHACTSFRKAVESLPETKPQSELRRLWLAAADANEAFSRMCRRGTAVSDDEFNRTQEAEYDAERALRDHLFTEHGLTAADLRRSIL